MEKQHKITFTAELDLINKRYITNLQHHLNGKWGHKEIAVHMAEIVAAFTEIMSEAYTKATSDKDINLN